MQDVLIVIDMQNDFIDGSLGSPEAQAIVPNVIAKINEYHEAGKRIIYTYDTHQPDYLDTTLEGKYLPVEHCIFMTNGWKLNKDIPVYGAKVLKNTFGHIQWDTMITNEETIEICGLCTDICVVSNALILRALYPNTEIVCDSTCCAGTTPENHSSALNVMRSCQINVT